MHIKHISFKTHYIILALYIPVIDINSPINLGMPI